MYRKPEWMDLKQWREKEATRHRRYAKAHPGIMRAKNARYYQAHKQSRAAYDKEYRAKNAKLIADNKKWRRLLRVLDKLT